MNKMKKLADEATVTASSKVNLSNNAENDPTAVAKMSWSIE